MALPPTVGAVRAGVDGLREPPLPADERDYLGVEAMLIIVFTYFYTSVQFNPVDQADNLRKYGGYIPGIRPGPPTAAYLDRVLQRLTLPGSLFLATVAVAPSIFIKYFGFSQATGPRTRRHLGADRRRRRARHDAPDGVADDDAPLRRIPPLNILILGPQGAGKGTQAKKIAAAYGDPAHRDRRHDPRDEGAADRARPRVAPIFDRGDLVPDEMMIGLIRDRLDRGDTLPGFVLDGFPRKLVAGRGARRAARARSAARSTSSSTSSCPTGSSSLERLLKRAAEETAPTTRPRRSTGGSQLPRARPSRSSSTTARQASSSACTPSARSTRSGTRSPRRSTRCRREHDHPQVRAGDRGHGARRRARPRDARSSSPSISSPA